MYDRPHLHELIDAARLYLEQAIIPAVQGDAKLYFQTLVAINVLKIAERELQLGHGHAQAEWHGLDALDIPNETARQSIPGDLLALRAGLKARNAVLSRCVRRGEYDADDRWEKLYAHIKVTTIAQLEVSNPRFLKDLAHEDGSPRTATSTSTYPQVEL